MKKILFILLLFLTSCRVNTTYCDIYSSNFELRYVDISEKKVYIGFTDSKFDYDFVFKKKDIIFVRDSNRYMQVLYADFYPSSKGGVIHKMKQCKFEKIIIHYE